jgi:alkaline phosphatase
MIEEQSDFIASLDVVVQWIETHGGWDETLLLLTADHDTGMIFGPASDADPFPPLVDNGPGKVPGLAYHTKSHANSLVPLYARGKGSERLAQLVRGTDEVAAKIWSISGHYVDNTDIFTVMKEAVLTR